MFAYGGDLFVIGGDTAAHTNDTKVYRLDLPDPTGGWQATTNDFEYRLNTQAAVVGDEAILPFGYLSGGAAQSWGRFRPDGTAVAALSTSYTARQGCGVVALDGVVYSIGGDGGTVRFVNRYDSSTGTWLAAETLPKTEGAFYAQGSAVAVDARIFAFSHQFTYVRQAGGEWTVDPFPIPRPVHNAAVGLMGGKIYVFGGSDYGGSTRYATILEFTPP